MTALRRNWPMVVLAVMWFCIVAVSSLAVASLWGNAAQILFLLPVFVLSLMGGSWVGRNWR